jgi:glycolate oxidase
VAVKALETEHVQRTLEVATRLGVPVVPQGARSGLSGGANAIDGCIALSLHAMDRILEIDAANRIAVVQPGVLNATLSRAVLEEGLFYPPDPSSWEFCSIGGNVATNAGGLCCLKYGVTTDFVLGLEVVLATGEVLRTGRRTVKGVAGYDLTKIIVGSEGTLCVVTEVTLALRPASAAPRTAAALFPDMPSAGAAVARVIADGLVPSLLEFMDQTSIRAVNAYRDLGFPEDAGAMLVAQADGSDGAAVIERIAEIFGESGGFDVAVADEPAEGELLLAGRRMALTALEQLGATLIDDVCVPRTRLAEFVTGVSRIADEAGLTIAVVGHAGDGNTHPTVIFDPTDADATNRAMEAFGQIMGLGLEMGGTITGEHGVGTLKREWLARELGPTSLRLQQGLKAVFDPRGILNPGKVFRQ